MIDLLALDLIMKNSLTNTLVLTINYDIENMYMGNHNEFTI